VLKGGNAVYIDLNAPGNEAPRRWEPVLLRLGKTAASRM
jgi:hypothetical protein